MDVQKRKRRRRKLILLMLMRSHEQSMSISNNGRPREIWQKQWLAKRDDLSVHHNILKELKLQNGENYRQYLKLDADTYGYILDKIRPLITKETTRFRRPISPEEQLAITLSFFATGETYHSLMYQYRVSVASISLFVPRVSWAIISKLKEECMPFPKTSSEWEEIAEEFQKKWNFPNCCGALDGKHIAINRPANSVSEYINYKGFYSIVLLALVDANYRFIYVC